MQHAAIKRSAAMAPATLARVGDHYRTLDLNSRVDAVSPHALVAMLFTGLREAIGAAQRSTTSVGAAPALQRLRAVTRALAIVDALSGSLDFARGGSVAIALADAYAHARALIVLGNEEARADAFAAAAGHIAELQASWNAIAAPASIWPSAN